MDKRKIYSPKQMADILGMEHQKMRKMLFDYKSILKEVKLTINDRELNAHGYKHYDAEGLMTLRLILTYKNIGVSRAEIIKILKDKKHDRMAVLSDQYARLTKEKKYISQQMDLIRTLQCIGPNDNVIAFYIEPILSSASHAETDDNDDTVEKLFDSIFSKFTPEDIDHVKKTIIQLSGEKGKKLDDPQLREKAIDFLTYLGGFFGYTLPWLIVDSARVFSSISSSSLDSKYDTSKDFSIEFVVRLLFSVMDEQINNFFAISSECMDNLVDLAGTDIKSEQVRNIVRKLYFAAKKYMYVRGIEDLLVFNLFSVYLSNNYQKFFDSITQYYFIENPTLLEES